MRKSLSLIIFLLIFSVIALPSQIEYELLFEKDTDCKIFSLMEMKNNFILAGIFNQNDQNIQDTSELIKIDPNGNIVTKRVFSPQSDTSYILHYTGHTNRSGYYMGIGEQNIGDLATGIHHIWIFEFDENLNILWEKIISDCPFQPLSMSFQYAHSAYYFLIATYPENDMTAIYKMDEKCEYILQKTEIKNGLFGTTCFMRQIPGSPNFLIHHGASDKYLYILDEDLNEITALTYNMIDLRYPVDGEFINEKEFISAGTYIDDGNMYNFLFGLKKTDITGNININQLEIFGREGLDMHNSYLGCRTGERKTFAMHDDYFYYGGVGRYDPFTYYGHDDNGLLIYAFNHDLDSLWSMTVRNDAYYRLWSIIPTDDGGCVMAAWRSDWRQGKNKWDTYIAKIAKPQFNDIAMLLKNTITVYPNPGGNRLFIKTETEQFIFQLYDMQGRLLLERQNDKEIAMDEILSGFYLYKIIDKYGEMSTGKWIKQ